MEDSHSLPHSSYSTSDSAATHLSSAQDHVTDAAGSANGAKYRLMSPAKLPISRSPCITIPPGLSPTSFLESPVLLSNIKVTFLIQNVFVLFSFLFCCFYLFLLYLVIKKFFALVLFASVAPWIQIRIRHHLCSFNKGITTITFLKNCIKMKFNLLPN